MQKQEPLKKSSAQIAMETIEEVVKIEQEHLRTGKYPPKEEIKRRLEAVSGVPVEVR